jgi:hypothetical protein
MGVLNYSTGTFGTSASGWPAAAAAAGWPTPPSGQGVLPSAAGWAIAPQVAMTIGTENSGTFETGFAAAGSQYAEATLAVFAPYTGASAIMFSRPFLLVPGFYALSYYYRSNTTIAGISGTYCGATPSAAGINAWPGQISTGHPLYAPSSYYYVPYDLNLVGVFLSNAQLVSTPNMMGTYGATTTYSNPDSTLTDIPPVRTTSTTPSVPPDGINLTNFQASTVSALLDLCGSADSWVHRTVQIEIFKPGYYWLTFSSQNADLTNVGNGGGIDAITLSALGSLAMTSPPTTFVPVPVGAPQPSGQQWASDNSFYIIADPPTFPAPQQ